MRKETLRVAYEEIKILGGGFVREKGEAMDKNKSHFHVSGKHRRSSEILEQQELAFWRGAPSKRLSGWTRDGSAEEIAGIGRVR